MSGKTSQRALSAAISQGILGSPSLTYEPGKPKHAGLFYDLDEFESGLDRAEEAFGKGKQLIDAFPVQNVISSGVLGSPRRN